MTASLGIMRKYVEKAGLAPLADPAASDTLPRWVPCTMTNYPNQPDVEKREIGRIGGEICSILS